MTAPSGAASSPPDEPATSTRIGVVPAIHSPNTPERMATILFPACAFANVVLSHAGSKPRLACSATSQESKTENNKDVAMPPKTRPNMRTS